MREFNSTNTESSSLNSTVQFFTPPSPQSNRARELHRNVRPRRRLFSSGGEGCNDQQQNHPELERILNDPVLITNLFNEESWAPVEGQFSAENGGSYRAPVEGQVPEESNGCPYWAPAEDHIPAVSNDSYSLHKEAENRHSCVPSHVPYNFEGTHLNYSGSMCGPSCLPCNLEGAQQNSESRNYDGLEPPTMSYNLEGIQHKSENDRPRELHHSVRPRKRLFSSGVERCNNQEQNHAELKHILNDPVLVSNLFNEESWAPVEGQFSAESGTSYRAQVEEQVPEENNGCPDWAPAEDHIPAESNGSNPLHNQAENRYSCVPSRMPYNFEGTHLNYSESMCGPSCLPYNLDGTQHNSESSNFDTLEPRGMLSNLEGVHQSSESGHYSDLDSTWSAYNLEVSNQNSESRNYDAFEPPRMPYNLEGIQNNSENDSLEPSVTPYNWEDALHNFLGLSNEEDLISLCETGSKDTQFEELNDGSWSDDDDFDGRYFDTLAWKPPTISDQQWRVLEAISQGKSVFVTGSAGTGKSYLLEFAKRVLLELYDPLSVFVTASTGIAACALKGRTLHSFAGIGLGDKPAPVLASSISYRENREVYKRWESARALIIDEISMIDGELFDKLDYIARDIRRSKKVFGGLQLVVTGDFFQLPPVKPANPRKQFAFEAKCWKKCFDMQIELKEVFRQADREFIGMLNEIRKGWGTLNTKVRLSNCTGPLSWTHGIAPTRLFPTKFDVRRENDMELKALNKEIIPFAARDIGPEKHLLDNGVAPKALYLCEGAQVVLIWNLDVEIGLVNGARGVVTGFICSEMREARDVSPKGLWPVVRFDCLETAQVLRPVEWVIQEGKSVVGSRTQVPLILAWALSVHKCQGMTLDRVQTNLSKAFEYGMVYVALSRVKNLEGLQLDGFDPSKIKAHPKVIKFYEKFTKKNDVSGNHTGHF